MIRVGVVGLGAMGQHHARLYSQLKCWLAGVADSNFERAREVGERYGVPYYGDYHDLLSRVDAVSVAVPTSLHHAVAMDFLQEGVHCLVEKPIAFSLDEATEMINMAERAGVNLAVGHIERFNPAVMKLKEIMDEGMLGRLLIVSTRRDGPFVSRITDVGAVLDTAIHDIGVARYLVGRDPYSVFSRVGSLKHCKEDHAVIVLDFDGTIACVEVNWLTPQKVRTLVATGSRESAYLDYIDQSLRIQDGNGGETVEVRKAEPLRIELEDFLASIMKGQRPSVDGAEGRAVLKISLESSRNNFCRLLEMAQSS